jgi:Family of unknown function (DUF5678)
MKHPVNNNRRTSTMVASPQNPESRWVAVDSNNNIISEGKTTTEVFAEAKKIAESFFLTFVPLKDTTYIF